MKTINLTSKAAVSLLLIAVSICFFGCTSGSSSETPSQPAALAIGQSYGGGKIFYLDGTGLHGLIAAPSDQTHSTWGDATIATNATGTALGTGQSNTTTIVGALGVGSYAAAICDQLVIGGYSDWYLPSRDELSYLYNQKALIGGLGSPYFEYWTSTEKTANSVYVIRFNDGSLQTQSKVSGTSSTRAIRSF